MRWEADFDVGLSPLARGNLDLVGLLGAAAGSIPACAGEPKNVASGISTNRVYPRLRGGTRLMTIAMDFSDGLSPLARGNHAGVWR